MGGISNEDISSEDIEREYRPGIESDIRHDIDKQTIKALDTRLRCARYHTNIFFTQCQRNTYIRRYYTKGSRWKRVGYNLHHFFLHDTLYISLRCIERQTFRYYRKLWYTISSTNWCHTIYISYLVHHICLARRWDALTETRTGLIKAPGAERRMSLGPDYCYCCYTYVWWVCSLALLNLAGDFEKKKNAC